MRSLLPTSTATYRLVITSPFGVCQPSVETVPEHSLSAHQTLHLAALAQDVAHSPLMDWYASAPYLWALCADEFVTDVMPSTHFTLRFRDGAPISVSLDIPMMDNKGSFTAPKITWKRWKRTADVLKSAQDLTRLMTLLSTLQGPLYHYVTRNTNRQESVFRAPEALSDIVLCDGLSRRFRETLRKPPATQDTKLLHINRVLQPNATLTLGRHAALYA